MNEETQTYEEGMEEGYSLAMNSIFPINEPLVVETDYHHGYVDGIEQAYRDQEKERLAELEFQYFVSDLEQEMER